MNFTCVVPNDTCLDVRASFSNYTGNEVETELQLKACGTKEDCKRIGNKTCTETGGKCTYTCCQHDLCNNDSLTGSLAALKCYHCAGPDGSTSLVFNHSTPLNVSYTAYQCVREQTEMYCPREYRCARILRVFQQDNAKFEVERRSCVSSAERNSLQRLCNTEQIVGNETSLCQFRFCESDLCNLASCVNLTPFFIAFTTMFGMISMR